MAICEPLGWHPKDVAILNRRLADSNWLHLYSSPTLCSNLDEVRQFVANHNIGPLVIVGPNERPALVEVAKMAESAGVPRFAIQTVPLSVYRHVEDGLMGETWALAVASQARKAAAATFASKAVTTLTRDTTVGRRELFFSLPRLIGELVEDPVMVPEWCSPYHSACRLCSEACLYSAISHEGTTARVDPTRCVHCGACAAVCPSGALQSPVFSDDEYRAFLREFASKSASFENPLAVFTSNSGISMLEAEARTGLGLLEGMVVVRAPCAAPLGWPHYLWAASAGVPVLSVFPAEEAARHPEAKGADERARAALRTLRGSYATLIGYKTLGPTEKMSEACAEASVLAIRRLGVSLVPPGPRIESMHALPPPLVSEEEVRSPSLTSFDVSVNEKCTLCGACTTVCPTKAFKAVLVDNDLKLKFYTSQCTGCGICVAECPEGAMGLSASFSPAWLDSKRSVERASDSVELCRKCGKQIGSRRSLKKLYDSVIQESQELASSVYLCRDCRSPVPPRPHA